MGPYIGLTVTCEKHTVLCTSKLINRYHWINLISQVGNQSLWKPARQMSLSPVRTLRVVSLCTADDAMF